MKKISMLIVILSSISGSILSAVIGLYINSAALLESVGTLIYVLLGGTVTGFNIGCCILLIIRIICEISN